MKMLDAIINNWIFLDCTNWPNGAKVFMSLIAIILSIAIAGFLGYRVVMEYRRNKEEKLAYIEGVASKAEVIAAINGYLTKATMETRFCLLFIDIDNFTTLQNAFGDSVVKKVINILANRIKKVLPTRVQIGRYGADQFLVFIRDEASRAKMMELGELILEVFAEPIRVNENMEVDLFGSVAIAFYPHHGNNFKMLLDSLNIANFIAKKEGGNRIVVYSQEMSESESENVKYYNQIKAGIQNKEFVLHYQPIVDLKTGAIYGIEGLLRWDHPEIGLLTPNNFIHILEQTGDINWISVWGLETLILEYNEVKKKFPTLDIRFCFNLSPKQLMNPRIVSDFQKVLKKHRFVSRNIILEIEQFFIFEQHDIIKNNILKLKEVGFMLAVDGFELDHGTLMKVEKLPIDFIKLDQAILGDDESSLIRDRFTQLLIDFAKMRKIEIIAERLENKEMIRNVLNLEIQLGQGYYLSPPITHKELLAYISDDKGLIEKVNLDSVKFDQDQPISYPLTTDGDELDDLENEDQPNDQDSN